MAKNDVFSYSSTAASNTDIDGLDSTGATGLVKSGDNYTRSLMSHIASGVVARGTDIATASTLDFTAAGVTTKSLIHELTGTVTVTAVTMTAGQWRICRAQGAFQLTASASLVVNGSTSSNYTTIANDLLIFEGFAAGVVRVWSLSGGGTVDATTSVKGIVELATSAETATGTDAVRAVTPDGLASLWQKGANVASAGTITLDDGGFFHVTGTTTITDIDWTTATDGRGAWLEFDGSLTLTHNATTLVLPGGANITTEAGDRAYVVQDSSDNVHVMAYIRASGNLTTSTGSAPAYAARAWVNFNGTGTIAIRASGNVSSITDNGTGDFTVNFTTALPDANYAPVASVSYTGAALFAHMNVNTSGTEVAPTSSACRFITLNVSASAVDPKYVHFAAFR